MQPASDPLASTPAPPYWAVVFTSLRATASDGRAEDSEGYEHTAARMVELAAGQPGYLGHESARGTDGLAITVSYWSSHEAIQAWRDHVEHLVAQRLGRERWYSGYTLRVCRVEGQSAFGEVGPSA